MESQGHFQPMIRLKIKEPGGKIDGLYLLFYCCLVIGAASVILGTHSLSHLLAALGSQIIIIIRDEILRPKHKTDPLDEIKSKLADIEGELSSIKFSNGIRRLE